LTLALPTGAKVRPPRLSPSAIDRYRGCPRAYWFSNVERARGTSSSSSALVIGNAIHHALERFFGLPLTDRSAPALEQALRSVWPSHRKPGTFGSREEEAFAGRSALELLQRFSEAFDISALPLSRERWVSCRLPNGIEVYGKVDRIDPGRAGGIDVVDYKTGKQNLEACDIGRESAALVYLVACEASFGKPVERVRYLYLQTGEELTWEPERDDVPEFANELIAITDRIAADAEFAASPGAQCRWCPWELQCPDSGRVELEDLLPVVGLPF